MSKYEIGGEVFWTKVIVILGHCLIKVHVGIIDEKGSFCQLRSLLPPSGEQTSVQASQVNRAEATKLLRACHARMMAYFDYCIGAV